MTTVENICDYINTIAPFENQEDWDNSGFLIGDYRKEVKTVVLSLDASKSAVEFAKSINADMLITHHPVIFSGVKQLKKGSAVYELVKNDISAVSIHTPFDKAKGGINDNLAMLLKLEDIRRLDNGYIVCGSLPCEMSIDDFALFVSDTLSCSGIRYTDTDKPIKTVALGGGSCGEFIDDAMKNADCFITGDLKYHEMLDASEAGFAVISAGHFETESVPFLMIKDKLEKIFTDVRFFASPAGNPILSI